ncbi:MAG: transposase, partial [Cyanobacteria bacterium CRU_2_1]|nr:transposase [Cyanobacteria bacterium CRU_2_1]
EGKTRLSTLYTETTVVFAGILDFSLSRQTPKLHLDSYKPQKPWYEPGENWYEFNGQRVPVENILPFNRPRRSHYINDINLSEFCILPKKDGLTLRVSFETDGKEIKGICRKCNFNHVHNPNITAETFYFPLLQQFLSAWEGMAMRLTLDTSVLWDKYCLIEVCLVWGGRSVVLGQSVLEHGSATVGFEDYRTVLETTLKLLPKGCQVMLLADRGFEHGELIRWLKAHQWSWAIRAKSDLNVPLSNGETPAVAELLPYSFPSKTSAIRNQN